MTQAGGITVLEAINDVVVRLGLGQEFSQIVGNPLDSARQLLALFSKAGRELAGEMDWPELSRTATFTLGEGQPAYALPPDISRQHFQTIWNRTKKLPLVGPLSPEEWAIRKSGIATTAPSQYFRVKGWSDTQLFIDPTPDSADAEKACSLEYQSLNWLRPATRAVSGLVVATGSYAYFGSDVYVATAGGTTEVSDPYLYERSLMEGYDPNEYPFVDGTVTWDFAVYDRPQADTDVIAIDPYLVIDYFDIYYSIEKGLPYERKERGFKAKLAQAKTALKSAGSLSLRPSGGPTLLSYRNIPANGYGG